MDVSLADLWLPILLSSVAIFFLSFIMWMVLPHHRSDYGKVPDEDGLMAYLGDIPRGQYMFPYCADPESMKDPELIKKREAGPSGLLTIAPRGPMQMGKYMGLSFVYNIVISVVVGYLATIAFKAGADGGSVFRFVATAAWLGYAGALGWGIWFFASGKATLKTVFDCLIYGVATGFLFMQFWPAA